MNAIAFGTKRVFHGFVRVTRTAFAAAGLTAARFDMMYAIFTNRGSLGPVVELKQRDVRRALGVSAPVVSRMLRSLEQLGLVSRRPPKYGDRRQRCVELTAAGEVCIRRACRMFLRGIRRIVLDAICFGRHREPIQRLIHMSQLESYLHVLRRDFGDQARLYYPWGHPDD